MRKQGGSRIRQMAGIQNRNQSKVKQRRKVHINIGSCLNLGYVFH